MIYRFYRYYFYRVWLWELNKNGGDFGTPFKTWYATCVLMFLNFGDLLLIVDILYHSVFNIDITIGQYFGVTMFIMMGILIPLLSYFLFVYKKKYRKFIDKFKVVSPNKKNIT